MNVTIDRGEDIPFVQSILGGKERWAEGGFGAAWLKDNERG
jgi:hypothetical protein